MYIIERIATFMCVRFGCILFGHKRTSIMEDLSKKQYYKVCYLCGSKRKITAEEADKLLFPN